MTLIVPEWIGYVLLVWSVLLLLNAALTLMQTLLERKLYKGKMEELLGEIGKLDKLVKGME
jgi:hypothetical protein